MIDLNTKIEFFKVNSKYILEGALTEIIWKVRGSFFVKIHQDSWAKGWFYDSNRAFIEAKPNNNEFTLYAFGWTGLVSSKIKMNVSSFSKSKTFKGNLKDDDKTSFSIRNKLAENKKTVLKGIEDKVKPTKVFLKNNEINIKIDSTNLKLN
tara:strand:+ start:496 stop:948 length:453 start_codon:yes stop_codon:yes gene_type:complete